MSIQPERLQVQRHREIWPQPTVLNGSLESALTGAQNDALFVVSRQPNQNFILESFNDGFAVFSGSVSLTAGTPVEQAFPRTLARQVTARLHECETSRLPVRFDLPLRKNRRTETWQITLLPLTALRQELQILGVAHRAPTGATVAIDNDVLEQFASTSHDILYVMKLSNRSLDYVNERVRAVLGYEPQELRGSNTLFQSLLHPADVEILSEHYRRLADLPDKIARSVEYRVRRADGNYGWLRSSDAVLRRDPSGAVTYVIGSAIDVTDNRHLLEDLKRISHRLLETQNEERKRIARELHDSTAQQLVALSVGLARLEGAHRRKEGGEGPDFEEVLRELRTIARDAQQEIRTLSYLLHPPVLESVGLADALRRFLAGFTRRTGIRTRFSVADAFSCGSHSVSTALMRIAQEALINVFRHAKATEVRVSLSNQNRRTILKVEDNGKGILAEPAWPDDRIENLGVGIPGMRARVRQFGGELHISGGKTGTIVRAVVPERAVPMIEAVS